MLRWQIILSKKGIWYAHYILKTNAGGETFFRVNTGVDLVNVGGCFNKKISLFERIKLSFTINKDSRDTKRDGLRDRLRASRIEPYISSFKPDVIIAYSEAVTRVVKLYCNTSAPVITMFHLNPNNVLASSTEQTKKVLSNSEMLQVLLPKYADDVRGSLGSDNVVYIPNSVPQYDLPVDVEKNRNNVIIYPARIDKGKRQHLLIEAFSLICEDFPNWKVEFWGDTTVDARYYETLLKQVDSLGMSKRVLFKGETNDIFKELKRAKICAFPSESEGFGLAMTEAMSSGLPVVAFCCCEFANCILQDKVNGFVCDNDIESFSKSLSSLMKSENERLRMGKTAKNTMLAYSPDKVWNQWEELLERVVECK